MTLAAGIACALIAGAILTGLRMPAEQSLAPFPARSVLDYNTSFRSGLAPLRQGFIREVLGGTEATPKEPTPSRPRGSRNIVIAPDEAYAPRTGGPHLFTNDSMANAISIERMPFTGQTNSQTATRDASDPKDCSTQGGTAWYRYTSKRTESVIANTFGTDHAIHLGVYERTGDAMLTLVACDADVAGTAFIQFGATLGATYFFQIADDVTGGKLVFNLEPPGTTELVSTNSSGEPQTGQSFAHSVSGDGRLIAYDSYAPDVHERTPKEPCHTRGGMPPWSYEELFGAEWVVSCPQVYVRDRSTGKVRLVSVSSSGEAGNLNSTAPWMSGDGRFVAFRSLATNLVSEDTNHASDIFVHDLGAGTTERVSISSSGAQLAGDPNRQEGSVGTASLSHDGRFVAFSSVASNLVDGDTNSLEDVFVHDRLTRRTERISMPFEGNEADGSSWKPSFSPDGRYVAFLSTAKNLTAQPTNGLRHLFVHDRLTQRTEIVSVSSNGGEANTGSNISAGLVFSADSRLVVFESRASNLVEGDTNGGYDIFLHDRTTKRTERVSLLTSGAQAEYPGFNTEREGSRDGALSANGRYVTFSSGAENLAEGTRNTRESPIHEDLYVRDLWTDTTARITVAPDGAELDIRYPSLSADGRTIGFTSLCYTECGTNVKQALFQVWVHDRPRGIT